MTQTSPRRCLAALAVPARIVLITVLGTMLCALLSAAAWSSRALGAVRIGTSARLVVLHPAERRAGLENPGLFVGLANAWDRGRLRLDVEALAAPAVQRLEIDGTADPRLRIWSMGAGGQVRLLDSLPLHAGMRGGLWHFDYRDERVLIALPGLEPTEVRFDDFSAPAFTLDGGIELAPSGWIHVDLTAGGMIVRLNETRIESEGPVTVEPRWRLSPTAAVTLTLAPTERRRR